MSIRSSFFARLALLAAAGAGSPLWSQETTVWRIGTFDHASAEFSGPVGSPPVVVDAGAPDAARDVDERRIEGADGCRGSARGSICEVI